MVAQNQIGLDLELLNDTYRWIMEEGYPDDPEQLNNPDKLPAHLEEMANYLTVIPIQCHGFADDEDEFLSRQIVDHPPFHLLKILLAPGGHEVPVNLKQKIEPDLFPEDWDERHKTEAWLRLGTLDPACLPWPFGWIKEMATYACSETGNVYLDYASVFTSTRGVDSAWFEWNNSNEIQLLRRQWTEVQPIAEQIRLFGEKTSDAEGLRFLLNLLTWEE